MKSVFLADDNREWLNILEIGINKEENLHVIGKAYNGKDAIESIKNLQPDIVILDIIMPEFDGAYIIENIRHTMSEYKPIIYILSGIGTDSIVKIINNLDVDFYSMKPTSMEIIIDTIKKIIERKKTETLKDKAMVPKAENIDKPKIKGLLTSLGISPHLFSTQCLVEAIYIYVSDDEFKQLITKNLYPAVAKKIEISNYSVEKNIRNAISRMQKFQTEFSCELFPYLNGKKISNGEFLTVVSDYFQSLS